MCRKYLKHGEIEGLGQSWRKKASLESELFRRQKKQGGSPARNVVLVNHLHGSLKNGKPSLQILELPSHFFLLFTEEGKTSSSMIKKGGELDNSLSHLLEEIHSPEKAMLADRASLTLFYQNAFKIFDSVLKPLLGTKIPERLLIIPDGKFCKLPFEALLTKAYQGMDANFLIEQTEISYAYGLEPQQHKKKKQIGKAFLLQACDRSLVSEERDYLKKKMGAVSLPTHSLWTGAAQMGNVENSLLHMAMHGQGGGEYNSSRLFPDGDGEVGIGTHDFFPGEKIPGILIFASCSSGTGRVEPGEGMDSWSRLAYKRGAYASVSALNKLPNAISAELMQGFYAQLEAGESAIKSLQLSRINYLRRKDAWQRHPAFWAGWRFHGNDFYYKGG